MPTTPLLAACVDAFGGDVDRLLVPDPCALQAATLPDTQPIVSIRYDSRGGMLGVAEAVLEVLIHGGHAEGNSILLGALLRDWLCQYPIHIRSFEWTADEETAATVMDLGVAADRQWLEVGRFLRDLDEVLLDHAGDFPEAPDGILFDCVFGGREMAAVMRRPDSPRLRLQPPNVLEVFLLCWGLRSQHQGIGTLAFSLWVPNPRDRSAHEKLEAKAKWAELARRPTAGAPSVATRGEAA